MPHQPHISRPHIAEVIALSGKLPNRCQANIPPKQCRFRRFRRRLPDIAHQQLKPECWAASRSWPKCGTGWMLRSQETGKSCLSPGKLELEKPPWCRPSLRKLRSCRIFASREDSALNNTAPGKHISHYSMDFHDFAARMAETRYSIYCVIRP